MSSIASQLPDFLSFNPLAQNKEATNKTQSSSAMLQVEKNSDITLFTAEGDKVTLSSASRFEASYATYSSQGVMDGNAFQVNAEAYSVSEAFVFELSVEGDLNKEELKDIKEALKTIEKLTSDFFAGKTEQAVDHAEGITKLDTIASFEAVLQYSKTLSAQVAVTETAPVNTNPPPQTPGIETLAARPEVLPLPKVSPPEAEATDDPPPISGPLLTPSILPPSAPVSDLVGQMSDAILASKITPSKIENRLEAFLDNLFAKFVGGDRMNLQELKLAQEVKAELSFSIKAAAEAEVKAGERVKETGVSQPEGHVEDHPEV
ncbi:hypothetical protein MNBD_NITROSPIRAE01-76 [hydrothermal vent metagenome]|uniref:DUF5610 domain-containing protein n=1 Tax=hydrothermal vent metagenome TaxID=652676 RepID=A0A3B1CTP3_9ZZZZ